VTRGTPATCAASTPRCGTSGSPAAVRQQGWPRRNNRRARDYGSTEARRHRIDTLVCRPARGQDWSETCRPLGIGSWARKDNPQKIGIVTDPPYPPPLDINAPIFREDGVPIGVLGDLGAMYFACRDWITAGIQGECRTLFKTADDLRSNCRPAAS
jgi:hypothetical protein